ncbi:MAG: DEAD/DEAH box helicase [Granulosicoccaceae bacterium]
MSFEALALHSRLIRATERQGFCQPTEIQTAAIPPALQGRDLLATARTGSGKTAAYALPLLQRWYEASPNQRPKILVLLPTRELAQQVAEAFEQLASELEKIKIISLYGGVSINPQLMALRGGADVVVATPGRLLDVIDHNGLDLWHTQSMVLDEADRLLDQGFADELDAVLCELPDSCQTLMFSATLAGKVEKFAKTLLNEPVVLKIEEPIEHIEQRAIEVDSKRRPELLVHLLEQYDNARALVFCASRDGAEALSRELRKHGLRVAAMVGSLSQQQRETVLEQLKDNELDVLVASDLAARGLDVVALPLVFNYDLPRSTPVYTHRVGRTGRAGINGVAISFIDADSHAHFALIEKRVGIKLKREQIAGFEPTDKAIQRNLVGDNNGGIKGKRMSKKDKARAAARLTNKNEPDQSA